MNSQPFHHYVDDYPLYFQNELEYDPYDESDDESDNAEIIEELPAYEKVIYKEAFDRLKQDHPFNEYYEDAKIEYNFAKTVRALLDNYTHEKALRFIAKTSVWDKRNLELSPRPVVERNVGKAVRQFCYVDNIHAIYRVISIKVDKYIVVACHMNVHAFNRGDLRFLEINHQTRTNAMKLSCVGHLALGDLIAVTGLKKIRNEEETFPNVYQVNQETPCTWMVSDMTLLKRIRFSRVPFSFLTNGTAVALKWGQVLTVRNEQKCMNKNDCIYLGNGFIPEKVYDFASGLTPDQRMQLIGLTREIKRYPLSTGTIFTHVRSPLYTEQMKIGFNAYRSHVRDPDAVVELCALMGATGVAAVSGGNFDCRSFRTIEATREQDMLFITIPNTDDPLPSLLWTSSTRITVNSSTMDANAVIETVMPIGDELKITARLSRDNLDFNFTDTNNIVSQREMPEGNQLRGGFLEKIDPFTNGRMILNALYGGPPIYPQIVPYSFQYYFPGDNPMALNQFQNEYVQRLLQKSPITLANSPFGCGKSVTIATAAFYAVLESRECGNNQQQLLVTQSNFASCNLVSITGKYTNKCRVIRYVSESNWLELPDECRTDLDLPLRMQTEFIDYVSGRKRSRTRIHLNQMAIYLREKRIMDVEDMCPLCRQFFREHPNARKYNFSNLTESFFVIFKPEIVITTSDSLRGVLPWLSEIYTVQFDEASQVPECALIQVLATFPRAYFGLVGDINQLPPFSDYLLTGHLKTFGIGNTMERAVANNLFPQVVLKYVYRCHPMTTEILGNKFYGGRLISGTTARARSELMYNRPDFWPSKSFPIMIYNNKNPGELMGTSMCNMKEIALVCDIVYTLITPAYNYCFNAKDIGIISYYKTQVSYLCDKLRGTNVKCGTVDSFQGMEREIMIVCLTNEVVNSFLSNRNRCNVAMSRAKQTTIIIGNVSGMEGSEQWETFVSLARKYKCIREYK